MVRLILATTTLEAVITGQAALSIRHVNLLAACRVARQRTAIPVARQVLTARSAVMASTAAAVRRIVCVDSSACNGGE